MEQTDNSNKKPALSHLSKDGNVNMVDVSGKPLSSRTARATGWISLNGETLRLIGENGMKKVRSISGFLDFFFNPTAA